ncbi:MAG: zinc-binding dehydrogenase [Acidimicrobiia bacterium]|nr:zinc-binding dehydrogenase [Acidimicrobiia bacterium]
MDESQSMMTTGVVVPRLGGPEVLVVRPWAVPAPAPDEVRVQVDAAGISFADLLICQGIHPERRKPPFVPGWDVVGEVDSVGSAVRDIAVGDRVAGLSIVGGWARHVVLPASRVVLLPHELEAEAAVCLVMDYIVAYQMLTRSASLKRGDTVLVQGAGGGVGTALMQVARALDVRVLGTDRERKRSHIEAQSGTLIDFETEDVVERCRELTGGRGVDVAFDGIGATARHSLQAVRPGGKLVWFGMVTMLTGGTRDLSKSAKTIGNVLPVFARNLVPGGKRTSLYSIQMLARKHPDWYREDLSILFGMLSRGEIDPTIAAVWKLDEVPAAAADMAAGALPGKQVINVAAH